MYNVNEEEQTNKENVIYCKNRYDAKQNDKFKLLQYILMNMSL